MRQHVDLSHDKEHYDEAVADLSEVLKIDPNNIDAIRSEEDDTGLDGLFDDGERALTGGTEDDPAGDNFDILPLRGYLVYAQGTQKKDYFLPRDPLNITKAELIERLKSEIRQGQNLISLPLIQDLIIKSSDLISQESQPQAGAIQEWDAANGRWNSGYNFFNTVNGRVKDLTEGHGYLVSVP